MGCLVIPCDNNYQWSIKNFEYINEFLNKKGFEIIDQRLDIHDYDFDIATNLKSSTFIVKKLRTSVSEYSNHELPDKYKKNFYGPYKEIPKYIIDDRSEYGIEEF